MSTIWLAQLGNTAWTCWVRSFWPVPGNHTCPLVCILIADYVIDIFYSVALSDSHPIRHHSRVQHSNGYIQPRVHLYLSRQLELCQQQLYLCFLQSAVRNNVQDGQTGRSKWSGLFCDLDQQFPELLVALPRPAKAPSVHAVYWQTRIGPQQPIQTNI